MQRKHNYSYIQRIVSPFGAHLYCKEILSQVFKNKQLNLHTLHFDASGKFVAETDNSDKRLLLYELVANDTEKDFFVPVAGMLASRHNSGEIHFIFRALKYDFDELNIWPICKRVCIDVSHALLIGINRAFNLIDGTAAYIQKCFEVVTKNTKPDFIIVQYCVSHFSKIISNFIDIRTEDKRIRTLFKEIMAYGMTLDNMNTIIDWWVGVIKIFGFKYQNEQNEQAYKSIRDTILNNNVETESSSSNENILYTEHEFSEEQISTSIYSNSQFYKVFNDKYFEQLNIYENSKKETTTINHYYIEGIVVEMNKQFGYCIPMWTNCMGIFVTENTRKTISNGPVECWFKTLSINVFTKRT